MSKTAQINIKINTSDGVKNVGELNDEINESVKSISSLETEFQRLSEEINSVEIGSDKFKQLQGELKSVDSELKNTKKSVEGLDFEAKAGEIGKLAGGVGAVGTAMALTFGDNEDIEAFFKTFAQGIAITQGLKGAMEAASAAQKLFNLAALQSGAIQAKNAVVAIASKVAMVAQAVATGAVTAAQWLWNFAMTANPIGLIIVGVGALIAGIALLIINIESVVDWFLDLNNVMFLLLGPIGMLVLGYQALSGAQEELVDSDIEGTKKQLANAEERKKAIDKEIDATKDKIKEIEHERDLKSDADDLYIKQAKAKGASEEELFQIQKDINAQNLALLAKEIEAKNLLISQQLQQADIMAEEGRLRLKLAVQSGNMDQAQADMNSKLIDDALTEFKGAKEEELLANQQALDNMIADNQIFLNTKKKANKKANEDTIEDLESMVDEINKMSPPEPFKIPVELEPADDLVIEDRVDPQIAINQKKADIDEIKDYSINAAFETTAAITDLFSQMNDRQLENSLSTIDDETSSGTEKLKAQLANREISQKQYDAKIAVLEKQKEVRETAAKRKAFNQSKALQIVNAVMGTAQAVISAFSSAAAIPIAGVALAPIMAGVAGALGAAQIAMISSQKFKAAKGGVVPGSPSMTDSVDALLAPGEMVINSNSAQMFPQALSAINQAGGGISLAPDIPVQSAQPTFQNNQQGVVKAIVVESDMTDMQKKVSRIERGSTFG